MKILAINSGSSSMKFGLFSVPDTGRGHAQELARGQISHIGPDAGLEASSTGGKSLKRHTAATNRRDAVKQALDALREVLPEGTFSVQAVGHRVVHGGDKFVRPTLLDREALTALKGLDDLAPLHNPPALEAIEAVQDVLGSDVPSVGVFDTAFHATMPDYAYTYALPLEVATRNKVRRYGFHGTAHEYMLQRYVALARVPVSQAAIITLQLGNGCSVCAMSGGRSVDTSMGFTPLEGLVMGTRSGDLDPSLVAYLAHKEQVSASAITEMLNEHSGLLGLSGRTGDMRDLLEAEGSDARAHLAIEIFCYRARKYIGAYMAALGGARAVIFGGGIGENAPAIRERICGPMEWCGLKLDKQRNTQLHGAEGVISTDGAPVAAYVVKVDEDSSIALHTAHCIAERRSR